MPNLQKIIKVTQEQYDILAAGGTVDDYTGIDPSYLYLVQDTGITCLTYANLKTLRDSSKLTPGSFYRITDYQCKIKHQNWAAADHQFDIIVRADAVNKLNEEAWAAHHSGDTYFANSNLAAWKIWYSLDNSAERFDWGDADGIIVNGNLYCKYMPHYRGPSVAHPYQWKLRTPNGSPWGIFTNTAEVAIGDTVYNSWDTTATSYTVTALYSGTGKGVIYRMIDEFGNDCPYDFKNITFTFENFFEVPNISVSVTNAYTFTCVINTVKVDASLIGGCHHNIIAPDEFYGQYHLHGNTFYSDTEDNGSSNNYLSQGVAGVIFKSTCSRNIISGGADTCYFNNSYDNIISGTLSESYFNRCNSNYILGEACGPITFGESCSGNIFYDEVQDVTLGNFCNGNIFGPYSGRITVQTGFSWSTFGAGCSSIIVNDNYYDNLIFDPGCCNISISCVDTNDTVGYNHRYVRYVHFHAGIYGINYNNKLPVYIPERELDHSIDYKMGGSETITLARPIFLDNEALKNSIGSTAREIIINNV